MLVILTWTGPQTVAQKGPAHMVLFSRWSTSLKISAIELSYILEYHNTHASNFGLKIGPDSSPKDASSSSLVKAKAQGGTHTTACNKCTGVPRNRSGVQPYWRSPPSPLVKDQEWSRGHLKKQIV